MLGLDAADEREASLAAAGAAGRRARSWQWGSGWITAPLARREEQLETTQRVALAGMQEPEGADAVHAAWRHVLQEAAQHLVGWEGEDLVPVIARVAVAEGDGVVVHREQRPVGHRGAVDVAAEILEDLVGAVGDGLGEHDPALLPGDVGEWHAAEGAPGEAEEAAAEVRAELVGVLFRAAFDAA